MVLRPATVLGNPLEVLLHAGRDLLGVVQDFLSEKACLNALGQRHFLLGVEQRNLADQLEVVLNGVSGCTSDLHGLNRLISVVIAGQNEALILRDLFDFALLVLQLISVAAIFFDLFDDSFSRNRQRVSNDFSKFGVF